jgi:guanylate kinase
MTYPIETKVRKILVLVGGIASGKTAVAKMLEDAYGYTRIVTYTTRERRPGEQEGQDYHFLTPREFKELEATGFFAEITSYTAEFGSCSYGSAKEDYEKEGKKVVVLNPYGVLSLTTPAYVVWLDIPQGTTMARALARGDYPIEIARRVVRDHNDFIALEISGRYDMAITEDKSVEEVAKILAHIVD